MQNVFIINYNSLYEILDEIKDNLSFKIIHFKSNEDFQKNNNLDIKNCLIISKIKPKLLANNKNTLDFENLPLPLRKIIRTNQYSTNQIKI